MIRYGNTEEEIRNMWKKTLKACVKFEVPVSQSSLGIASGILSQSDYKNLEKISTI